VGGGAQPVYEAGHFDVVVVGGGTAGAVVASRLSEDPDRTVCLVEAGPSDVGDARLRWLHDWPALVGSALDADAGTDADAPGRRPSRARVLGGCSSTGAGTALRPLPGDWQSWVDAGAAGWEHLAMSPYWVRLLPAIRNVAEEHRSAVARDFVEAAADTLDVPVLVGFNSAPFDDGVGFVPVTSDPLTDARASASVAYLHPFLTRPNLTVHTQTWAGRLETSGDRVTGVRVRHGDGTGALVRADDVVLCAGAVDSPRLLLQSGVGPADALRALGVDVVADLPGVGDRLVDRPEVVLVRAVPERSVRGTATGGEAAAFVRRDGGAVPDLRLRLSHVLPAEHLAHLGHGVPDHGVALDVGAARPESRGSVRLVSADPAVPPAVDLGLLSDPDGRDAAVLAEGVARAREVLAADPLSRWLGEEAAPGEGTADGGLEAYVRRSVRTGHHLAGSCAMGGVDHPAAVVDPDLRVRGLANLRVADASVFPTLPTVDPLVAVLMVAERAADLVARGRPVI
jgi:choline dehydrogenase